GIFFVFKALCREHSWLFDRQSNTEDGKNNKPKRRVIYSRALSGLTDELFAGSGTKGFCPTFLGRRQAGESIAIYVLLDFLGICGRPI
ncbi:MAG: hypothetical protein J7K96_05285, partial [Desulfobacteraceae bacterium]|nr:hypothetical protein [Desulfobacteraceae bacterium]